MRDRLPKKMLLALSLVLACTPSAAFVVAPPPSHRTQPPVSGAAVPCMHAAAAAELHNVTHISFSSNIQNRADLAVRTRLVVAIEEETPVGNSFNAGSLIGYLLFLVYLAPIFIRAAAPQIAERINMFTEIANNAADEAMAAGSLQIGSFFGYPIQDAFFAQGVFKDLIAEYFASGQSTAFLTAAGGVCAKHAAWCDSVIIVP